MTDREMRLVGLRKEAQELRELIQAVEAAKAAGSELSLRILFEYGRALARLPQVEREVAELEGRAAWE